ncbi:MAG: 50S ribosomal protein L13 [Candidatus Nanoarchaeia archaeon]|nr:50S ribosomal protein L13 [Candidatus Nanoarchaeia archaeon]MDD5054078.1 50S ribosomal protein L13 [Candidatus Nanoarchaeia archaeon]MDD5499516.1 50S ribosomal protein L13 [Candidatus Nanoarchaeia archaeon]
MDKIIIDADACILGRLSVEVSKLSRLKKEIIILNCDKVVISGSKKNIMSDYLDKLHRGSTEKGPFQPKRPDRLVRRTIRGMMNYKGFTGKPAYARIKTFIGVPDEYKDKISKDFKCKKASDLMHAKFLSVGEVCRQLGGKW